jgi:signal transduction histidine kinase
VGAAKIAREIGEAKRLQRAERELTEQLQNLTAELEQQVDEGQALQEELEQSNEQLLRSLEEAERARQQADQANASKSDFLATMSHEFRTPLNAIIGYIDLLDLELRGPLVPAQRADLARVKRSANALLRLIDDILSFAKIESGRLEYRFEEVSVNELAAALESFIAPRVAQKGLSYEFAPCRSDLTLATDRAKVEQIMLNLLSNAVKFTESGQIRVTCTCDDQQVRLEVQDTGRGLRDDTLEKIFEPFVQGDRPLTRVHEGTGLGLAISRQFARAMSGDILVRSALGEGSSFTLVLPRTPTHLDGLKNK